MRDEPENGVVANPWAQPSGAPDPEAAHRPGDWGGDPAPRPWSVGPNGPLTSPARRLRPARIAVATASVLAAVELLSSAWALWETRSVAGDEPRGGATPLNGLTVTQDAVDRLNAASSVDSGVALVGLVALIVSAVFVIRWQNVVVGNQRGLGIAQPRYSPLAAGFSWFVPIWSLFGPKRALNDAWRAAEPTANVGTPRDTWLARSVPRLFGAWWTAWLVGQVLGNVVSRAPDSTLAGQTGLYVVSLVASVATVAAGVLFVATMERLTERHDARIAERDAATA